MGRIHDAPQNEEGDRGGEKGVFEKEGKRGGGKKTVEEESEKGKS